MLVSRCDFQYLYREIMGVGIILIDKNEMRFFFIRESF